MDAVAEVNDSSPYPSENNDQDAFAEINDSAPFPSELYRVGIWLLFSLGLQVFMSYDSGATPASLDTMQKEGLNLTQTEIGVLGSLDKFGMTIAGVVWGRALQIFPTKPLLVSALFANLTFTFIFGALKNKYLMFLAKFVMGTTQGLQGVWGTVWTLTFAPEESKTTWMGMCSIAAGLGNGLGTFVAGMATANGFSYSFSFFFQASVLTVFWFIMLLCPSTWFQLPRADQDSGQGGMSASAQFKEMMKNRVYLYTALAIAFVYCINTGIQFLWVRLFVDGEWTLDKNTVTIAFLAVTGGGSFAGVAVGPQVVDRYGGYADNAGKYRSLCILVKITWVCTMGGVLAILMILVQHFFAPAETWDLLGIPTWPPWIWLLWIAVGAVFGAGSAGLAPFTAINVEVVPEEMRSFASGATISIGYLGFAAGSLIPGLFIDLSGSAYARYYGEAMPLKVQLDTGFIFTCCFTFVLLLTVMAASRAASNLAADTIDESFVLDLPSDFHKRSSFQPQRNQPRPWGADTGRKSIIQYLGAAAISRNSHMSARSTTAFRSSVSAHQSRATVQMTSCQSKHKESLQMGRSATAM